MTEDADNPFDLEQFRLPEKVVAEGLVADKRRRRQQQFVKFPNSWAEALRGARRVGTYRIALYLLHQRWKNGECPITLSNVALEWLGVTRWEKWRALAELEQAGLIKVEKGGPGRAPRATIL
jgi:diketogulonate reductase-like aldo/keto reductase